MPYVVEVADEDELLERSDVGAQYEEPLGLEAHLVHVDVAGRHVLVAVRQPFILDYCCFFFVENIDC